MCWRARWSMATAWAISGAIGAGDIQWMTAGSGIIHQEMPKGDARGRMHGFQLWANLPAALKMTAPRYQEVKAPEIPEVTDDDGTKVRVICGKFWGKTGPVEGIAADPRLSRRVGAAGKRKHLPVETTRHAFAYVFAGSGTFCNASEPLAVPTERVGGGATRQPPSEVNGQPLAGAFRPRRRGHGAGGRGRAFASCWCPGKPLEEPVAWYGPIVMNTAGTAAGVRGAATGHVHQDFTASLSRTSARRGRDVPPAWLS